MNNRMNYSRKELNAAKEYHASLHTVIEILESKEACDCLFCLFRQEGLKAAVMMGLENVPQSVVLAVAKTIDKELGRVIDQCEKQLAAPNN